MQDRIDESDESRSTSPAVAQKLKQKSHYYTQSSECEAKKKKKMQARRSSPSAMRNLYIIYHLYQENSVFFFLFKHVFNLQVNFFSTCPLLLLLFNSNISAIIFSFPSKKKKSSFSQSSVEYIVDSSKILRSTCYFFLFAIGFATKKKKRKKKSETARAWPFYFQL